MNTFIKLSVAVLLLAPSFALASEIVLKSGQRLEGKIIEQTDKYVKFDEGVGVPMTYYLDEIDTLDGQKLHPPSSKIVLPAKQVAKPAEKAQVQNFTNITPDGSNNYKILTEEEKKFTEAMNQYIYECIHMNTNDSVNDMQSYLKPGLKKLNDFQLNYPNSPLSIDADYVTYIMVFIGASIPQKFDREECEEMISKMKRLVQRHPNSKVDHLTIELLRGQSAPEALIDYVSIPYNSILNWMRGHSASSSPDFDAETIIKYFSVFNDELMSFDECDNKCKKNIADEVYTGLAGAFVKLNKKDELKNLSKEAAERFPDDKELNQHFQDFFKYSK